MSVIIAKRGKIRASKQNVLVRDITTANNQIHTKIENNKLHLLCHCTRILTTQCGLE
jgi:hypothetical protein